MRFLNLAWPALYYMRGFWSTWYIIILTLVIEIFLTKWLLKSNYLKTSIAVASANLISATVGIYLVMWGMFYYWHPIMDNKMPNATFDIEIG